MTPAERKLQAQLAANTRWSRAGSAERSAQGRALRDGFVARFERQVDPDGELLPAERAKRAESAMRAHMALLALASVRKRRRGS